MQSPHNSPPRVEGFIMQTTGYLYDAEYLPVSNVVSGRVFGDTHRRFKDGDVIRTSNVVRQDLTYVETLNSLYRIISWKGYQNDAARIR
jgi:hypothetical protein